MQQSHSRSLFVNSLPANVRAQIFREPVNVDMTCFILFEPSITILKRPSNCNQMLPVLWSRI
jgi:hypothetical protein